MKKIALFLALVLTLGSFPVLSVCGAEEKQPIPVTYEELKEFPERTVGLDCYEVLENTSFETLTSPENLYFWSVYSKTPEKKTTLGDGPTDRSTDANTGDYALKLTINKEGQSNVAHGLVSTSVTAGEVYELSAYVKKLEDCENVHLSFTFSGKKQGVAQSYPTIRLRFNDVKAGDGYVRKVLRFTAPEYASQISLQLRLLGKGEVLWDDVSLLHITDKMPKPSMPDVKPALQQFEIKNPDFEGDTPGETPKDWEIIGDVKASDAYAHSGEKSIALRTTDGSKDAIGTLYMGGFEKGATYQISAWLLNPEETQVDMGFWIHYSSKDTYDHLDASSQIGLEKPRWKIRTTHQWQQYIAEFTPPDDTKSVMIYFRHRLTPGVIYMDDVSVYMVKPPNALNAKPDAVFYYTEWEKGYISCEPYVIQDPGNTRAEFSFVEADGTETHKETFTNLTVPFKYTFRTEWMKEKGQQYYIRMHVYDGSGAVIQAQDFPVFRYDRPTYLGADGVFRKNGKEIIPTLGSGIKYELLEFHPEEGGITFCQMLTTSGTTMPLKERMDAAYAQGMFVIINLYAGSKSAGHPDQIDSTKLKVETYKDHPALFGWKIHDEPYQKGTPDSQMIAAYKAIRDLDPHHPIYIDDSPMGSYEWLFQYCDILDVDYYGGSGSDAGRVFTDVWEMARKASGGRKPFSILLQASEYSGYLPSFDELRHQTYQAFFSGASAYGYHTLGREYEDVPYYLERPEWMDIVEKWAPWERGFMLGCFVTGEYTFVNYQKTDDVLWGTFTDGTDLYAIVLNRNKSTSTTAEIPLVDGAGTLQIADFTATRMTGNQETITGSASLKLDLAPLEAVVWKVTPSIPMDASHLASSTIRDIIYYPWAYNAIATLEEKGIVNRVSANWYGPERNITRGDYAMFLVRTLGLTEGAGENFADVDPGAEYAKELAIGKAAGIINGVGDNKFNPEAQITRQDMMTMTSRALSLAGAADLGAFSDAGSIADYASAHVSAMVAEGLIKGNADGTINPLGNTTRAEAAVIMQRIINK